jgi:hypothetical protein
MQALKWNEKPFCPMLKKLANVIAAIFSSQWHTSVILCSGHFGTKRDKKGHFGTPCKADAQPEQ